MKVLKKIPEAVKRVLTGPKKGTSIESLNDYYQWYQNNTYCYNLYFDDSIVADSLIKNFDHKTKMQQDLNSFIGMMIGVEGRIELRMVKSLVLKKLEEPEIFNSMTAGKDHQMIIDDKSVTMLCGILGGLLHEYKMPVVDATGLKGRYTWIFHGELNELNNVRMELKRYGLRLEEEYKLVDVLVFRQKRKGRF